MKNIFLLNLFLITLINGAFSQIDYLKQRDKNEFGCSDKSEQSLQNSKLFLDSINPKEISNGKMEYLHDKGMLYYMRFAKWKKQEDFETSKLCFESSYSEFGDLNSVWNLMILYSANNNCEMVIQKLNSYITQVHEITEFHLSSINAVKKKCLSKNETSN